MPVTTEAAIWERVIHPRGKMSKQTARAILALSFPADDQQRMRELSAKNKEGALSAEEELELDHFCRVGRTLTILKSRARKLLNNDRWRE
ncbi:MAG: hypothetical protein L0Y71_09600 [Gemmataceae bacterium]|nr:hypothetical protein [Gemmataceae bacterium]